MNRYSLIEIERTKQLYTNNANQILEDIITFCNYLEELPQKEWKGQSSNKNIILDNWSEHINKKIETVLFQKFYSFLDSNSIKSDDIESCAMAMEYVFKSVSKTVYKDDFKEELLKSLYEGKKYLKTSNN